MAKYYIYKLGRYHFKLKYTSTKYGVDYFIPVEGLNDVSDAWIKIMSDNGLRTIDESPWRIGVSTGTIKPIRHNECIANNPCNSPGDVIR